MNIRETDLANEGITGSCSVSPRLFCPSIEIRATLTTYDGREKVSAEVLDADTIIAHGELDVVLLGEDEYSYYLANGDAIFRHV